MPNLLLGGLVCLRGEVGKQSGSAVFDGNVTRRLGQIGGSKRRQLHDQSGAAVRHTRDTVSDDTRKTYTRAGCAAPWKTYSLEAYLDQQDQRAQRTAAPKRLDIYEKCSLVSSLFALAKEDGAGTLSR